MSPPGPRPPKVCKHGRLTCCFCIANAVAGARHVAEPTPAGYAIRGSYYAHADSYRTPQSWRAWGNR